MNLLEIRRQGLEQLRQETYQAMLEAQKTRALLLKEQAEAARELLRMRMQKQSEILAEQHRIIEQVRVEDLAEYGAENMQQQRPSL